MDREWMSANRLSEEWQNGLKDFLRMAKEDMRRKCSTFMHCPCRDCSNIALLEEGEVRNHLQIRGFDLGYKRWIWHGENEAATSSCDGNDTGTACDKMGDMITNVLEGDPKVLASLLTDNEKELYPGCPKYTRLSATLKLFNLKAAHGWTDVSFTALLSLLKDMLPDSNELPNRTFEAKKILCPMGMHYRKIHACPNDCMLFRGEFENTPRCDNCKAPRYKYKNNVNDADDITQPKGPPVKVVWYLPIIERLKRLYSNVEDAKNLRWHADREILDNKLRHPADSPQWKKTSEFDNFGDNPRNLKVGVCVDGMNPYGTMSTQHSSWPCLINIYNLPPSLCMKRKYIMLSMLISGPKQPGNNIDVYLQLLIDDLQTLWKGVDGVYDAYARETFTLRAMVFCTVSDFPAYGNLSGWHSKGKYACPVCADETSSIRLMYGKKNVYMDTRRFLRNRYHPYRNLTNAFNGKHEHRPPPIPKTGEEVYEQVKDIKNDFGKSAPSSRANDTGIIWKKRSVFWDLPYWKILYVRNCLDVMHIEKNVCESVVGTLLNIPGKTKDGYNARMNLAEMGLRSQLAPGVRGTKTFLPPACYTLSKAEKRSFLECLAEIKVPSGYSSNISNRVSLKEGKLVGMKSHDCHVLMQHLLPVAIRGILPKHVRHAITRLCFFFNSVCSKVIDPDELDKLEDESVITLCQLEMFFPPGFFDPMVHFCLHIVREIRMCGPVFLRWMYPFERYMKILKGYVKTRFKPNSSMVEGYVAEEVIEFCTEYLSKMQSIGVPKSRHEDRVDGKGIRGAKCFKPHGDALQKAHLFILRNSLEVQPFVQEHLSLIREMHPYFIGN